MKVKQFDRVSHSLRTLFTTSNVSTRKTKRFNNSSAWTS